MFTPTLKMLNVEPVGGYAIRIDWSDGHGSGIYSFDYLVGESTCTECGGRTSVARRSLALLCRAGCGAAAEPVPAGVLFVGRLSAAL
jgi:hypothetical protein